jgi:CRP/FNR family transcriptional regulator, cyclic AMP receptor protein
MAVTRPVNGHHIDPSVSNALDVLKAQLGTEPLARLLTTSHQRTAYPGEVLVHIGQTRLVGVLLRGLLKSVASFPNGQNPTVHYMQDGEFFGLSTLFHPAPMSIHVVKTARVLHLDASTIAWVAQEFPVFGWFVARELAASVLRLPTTVELFGCSTVRERIAAHLIRLSSAEKGAASPIAHLTQEALADSVGSAREVVWRCLRSLRDEGLIAVAPRAVYILDEQSLARVAARLDPQAVPSARHPHS